MSEVLTFAVAVWSILNEVDFHATGHYSCRWHSDPGLDRWSPTRLATNTHTLLREGPTGHETHQWRLSTSRHSNVTIKERSRGQPPTSKWCLSALTLLSTLFIRLNINLFLFSYFPELTGHAVIIFFQFLSLLLLPCFVCFYSSFSWLYEKGKINIICIKTWENLLKLRYSRWKNSVKQVCWILNTAKSILGCSKSFTTAEGWEVIVHENSFYNRRMFISCSL